LRALLAASPDPLIVLDRSGRCAFGNTAAGEMSEFEPMSLGRRP
jgi:PAS domain-containing protein